MAKYYPFQVTVHTMTGTHVFDETKDKAGKVVDRVDTGVEEDYKVSQCTDGHWECSCKAWIFGRKYLYNGTRYKQVELDLHGIIPNGRCKHIMFVIENSADINSAIGKKPLEPIRIQGKEFYLEIDGRIAGFIDCI